MPPVSADMSAPLSPTAPAFRKGALSPLPRGWEVGAGQTPDKDKKTA